MYSDFFGLKQKAKEENPELYRMFCCDPSELLMHELVAMEALTRKGGKRKTCDTHAFEMNLVENLTRLKEVLWAREYKPSRGTAHIIFNPVIREIFAAPYVDRIVHTYIVLTLMQWWEPRLNYGSCSCRIGRGTSFGIELLRRNIQSVSRNYTRPVYIIKLDISGYFMHIQRDILYKRVMWGLGQQFRDKRDLRYAILKHAIREVIFDNPTRGVKICGSYEDWRHLPDDKSLFLHGEKMGMVIGNYTSQDFSNIYLDPLDRFITMDLGYKKYVRYVDDFAFVVTEEQLGQVRRDIEVIDDFLGGLGLSLNRKKTRVIPSWQGVPFLGMVVKESRVMPGKRVYRNFRNAAYEVMKGTKDVESLVSYLGLLCNYDAGKVCQKVFDEVGWRYNL